MHRLCTTTFHFKTKPRILWRISTLRRYLRSIWRHILSCWMRKSSESYRHLPTSAAVSSSLPQPTRVTNVVPVRPHRFDSGRDSSDLVSLKISLLGDSQIGKTSFLKTYAGEEESELTGMNQVDKILYVKGARISYSIWEIGDVGDGSSPDRIPIACKDSVALLFMFDLTSRRTLNSVIRWYQDARKWNPTGIPVLIGTKFDEFVQLPIDLQWTIASEARAYAKALNATLFFSSATYNINVNKIFKFITAKLFDLQWNVERNLNIGEPMIDF